ncbi:uncharacterized protein [Watersipora subatra]|uniref:uncharacterized protein n=1 Tax=Watersipora subatra TaxID=2589382 RepID=UPI00355B0C48
MMNNPLSAENFSQIYASLETLNVSQIVSTLLTIAPLRDEILKRLKPVRRKRKSKDILESPTGEADSIHNSPQVTPADLRSPSREPLSKKKPRKSKPAKLHRSKFWNSYPLSAMNGGQSQRIEDCTPSLAVNSNAITTANSSRSSLSSSSPVTEPVRNSPFSPAFLNNFYQGGNAFSAPYWNVFRMTANQLLYSYNQQAAFKQTVAEQAAPKQTPVELTARASPISTDTVQSPETTPSSCQQEDPDDIEEAINVIDETENTADDEMVQLEENDQPLNCHKNPTSIKDDNERLTPENAAKPNGVTDISCPDCGLTVLLSNLTHHMQDECSNQSKSQETATPLQDSKDGDWKPIPVYSETAPQRHLNSHIQEEHAHFNNTFNCNMCNESFRNKSSLKRHKIIHTVGGGHTCSYCAKIFAKPELLRRHELLHTELKRTLWPCTKCKKSFSNKYNLAVHDRMHTGELPFPCPKCPERFRVKCSMQNHVKSRHGQLFTARNNPHTASHPRNGDKSEQVLTANTD